MNRLYKEEKFEYPTAKEIFSSEEIVGDAWKAYATDHGHIVKYISGELAGRTKELKITSEEFRQLKSRNILFDSLLIKYGCN
jgi:hypothetical protein